MSWFAKKQKDQFVGMAEFKRFTELLTKYLEDCGKQEDDFDLRLGIHKTGLKVHENRISELRAQVEQLRVQISEIAAANAEIRERLSRLVQDRRAPTGEYPPDTPIAG